MDDFDLKVKRFSIVMLFVCIGIIIFCLLSPTQSFGKTFCLCASSVGIAQCIIIQYFL